jgi:hypothetical protein
MNWLKKLLGLNDNEKHSSESTKAAAPPEPFPSLPQIAFRPHNEIEQLLMDAAVNVGARAPRYVRPAPKAARTAETTPTINPSIEIQMPDVPPPRPTPMPTQAGQLSPC